MQGTLDLLILRALELAPMHRVGVAARIEPVTRGAFMVKPGSLSPAWRRLEQLVSHDLGHELDA
jgi:DNA-binding PadR family transcriptional regulator